MNKGEFRKGMAAAMGKGLSKQEAYDHMRAKADYARSGNAGKGRGDGGRRERYRRAERPLKRYRGSR